MSSMPASTGRGSKKKKKHFHKKHTICTGYCKKAKQTLCDQSGEQCRVKVKLLAIKKQNKEKLYSFYFMVILDHGS